MFDNILTKSLLQMFDKILNMSLSYRLLICEIIQFWKYLLTRNSRKMCIFFIVFPSIHREGFISMEQVGYEGIDQRCYVEDLEFLYRFSSSLLWNAEPNLSTSRFILFAHQKRAEPRLNQCTSPFQNMRPHSPFSRRYLWYGLNRESICFQT